MNQEIQQYIRIAIYTLVIGPFLAPLLKRYGIVWTDDATSALVGIVIGIGTLGWTIYGSRVSNLMKRVKATRGVEEATIVVDPDLLNPKEINKIDGVSALPSAASLRK